MSTDLVVLLVGFAFSVVLTGLVRRYALRSNLLDVPNARSSHSVPTPRGGGLGLVVVFSAGLLVLAAVGAVPLRMAIAMVPAAVAVALAGFIDDRKGLRPAIRFAVHAGAAFAFLWLSRPVPPLGLPWLDAIPWLAFTVALLSLVWLLNLYNFMDGIDGIAGMEAVFAAGGLAIVAHLAGGAGAATTASLLMTVAAAGFLVWNWPPAKIFMGDVGSGFIGLVLGMLSVETLRAEGVTVFVPAILLAGFVADATVTLARRFARGERVYDAHRTHAYQWLSRRWAGHRPVVLSLLTINLVWLLPLALLALRRPGEAAVIAGIAYAPLVAIALWAGAGRPEAKT